MKSQTAIICVIAALLSGCAGRLAPPETPRAGWVDFVRVRADSALGKRMRDDDAVFGGSRQQEVDKISQQLAAAEKTKDKDLDSKRVVAQQKVQQFNSEIKARDDQDIARILTVVQSLAAKVATERHLVSVDLSPPGRLWSADDVTDEVIRRMDIEDSKTMAEDNARLKAELAAAKAKK